MTKLFFVLSSALALTACGKAEITSDCSLNGRGDVSCTFKNNGSAKGSACEYIALISKDKTSPAVVFVATSPIGKLAHDSFKKYDKKLSINDEKIPMFAKVFLSDENRVFSGNEICSGVVEPQDVRKSEAFVNFGIAGLSPYEACNGKFEDSWTIKCGFTTYPKEKVVAMLNELSGNK